jgi:hypothetical protein
VLDAKTIETFCARNPNLVECSLYVVYPDQTSWSAVINQPDKLLRPLFKLPRVRRLGFSLPRPFLLLEDLLGLIQGCPQLEVLTVHCGDIGGRNDELDSIFIQKRSLEEFHGLEFPPSWIVPRYLRVFLPKGSSHPSKDILLNEALRPRLLKSSQTKAQMKAHVNSAVSFKEREAKSSLKLVLDASSKEEALDDWYQKEVLPNVLREEVQKNFSQPPLLPQEGWDDARNLARMALLPQDQMKMFNGKTKCIDLVGNTLVFHFGGTIPEDVLKKLKDLAKQVFHPQEVFFQFA